MLYVNKIPEGSIYNLTIVFSWKQDSLEYKIHPEFENKFKKIKI